MNAPLPSSPELPAPPPSRWQRYTDFWNEREAPHALAVLRIAFGLALVVNIAHQFWAGQVLEMYADIGQGGIFSFKYNNSPYSLFQYLGLSAAVVWALASAQLFFATTLTLGLFTRVSAVAVWMLQATFYDRMVLFRYDGDNVYRVACWLMVLAPAGACWSLDAVLFGAKQSIPRWPRRLFQAQLAIIYTRTGLVKLSSSWSFMDSWQAIYLAVNLPGIARWNGDWAARVFPLTQLATLTSKWFEVTYFLLPLNQFLRRDARPRRPLFEKLRRYDLRPLYVLLGCGMHMGILILMDVGFFSVVMMSLYTCWIRPEEARRAVAWVRARLTSRRSPASL